MGNPNNASMSEESQTTVSRGIGGYVTTWLLSVASAAIVGWAWVHTHPTPKFVAIDLSGLVKTEMATLTESVKQGATKEQQENAIRRASEFGSKLDRAIATLADECGCVVVNGAAIVAQPRERAIPDATARVREILSKT